jgi:hypothetical protein
MESFFKPLERGRFQEAFEKYKSLKKSKRFQANYVNKNKTVFHAIINSCLENIDAVVEEDAEGNEKLNKDLLSLLNALITEKCPLNIATGDGKFPLDLFSTKKSALMEEKYTKTKETALQKINWFECFLINKLDNTERLVHGKKYTTDLTLRLKSKTPEKECEIPDFWSRLEQDDVLESRLTLHQRLFLCSQYLESKVSPDSKNIVVATVGFVISYLMQQTKNNGHQRMFINFPLNDATNIILGEDDTEPNLHRGTHSEDELIRYLNANAKKIVKDLIGKINSHFITGFHQNFTKIYAVVLDIHSTAEICNLCTINLINLQKNYTDGSFMKTLQEKLHRCGFILPKKSLLTQKKPLPFEANTPVLKLIIRASGLSNPNNIQYIATKNSSHIPTNIIEGYSKNIKDHNLGVILHLPPDDHPTLPCEVIPLREARKGANLEAWPHILECVVKKGFFSFNLQTGFSNCRTAVRTQTYNDAQEEPGKKEQKEIKNLKSLKRALSL